MDYLSETDRARHHAAWVELLSWGGAGHRSAYGYLYFVFHEVEMYSSLSGVTINALYS